jgi:hypothetical protein
MANDPLDRLAYNFRQGGSQMLKTIFEPGTVIGVIGLAMGLYAIWLTRRADRLAQERRDQDMRILARPGMTHPVWKNGHATPASIHEIKI